MFNVKWIQQDGTVTVEYGYPTIAMAQETALEIEAEGLEVWIEEEEV